MRKKSNPIGNSTPIAKNVKKSITISKKKATRGIRIKSS